jgi:hypothetical protein
VYSVKINKGNEEEAWLILLLRQGSRKTGRLEKHVKESLAG